MSSNENWGWIYFIGSNWEEVKIGFSVDPKKRLKQIQTSKSTDLRILLAMPGTRSTEKELHELCGDYCIRGEWFDIEQLHQENPNRFAIIAGLAAASKMFTSWSSMEPFDAFQKKKKSNLSKHKKALGAENFALCETLFGVSNKSSKQFDEFLAKLVHNTREVNPSSNCMNYGLLAALKQSIFNANYVLGAAVQGFNEGRCSNE